MKIVIVLKYELQEKQLDMSQFSTDIYDVAFIRSIAISLFFSNRISISPAIAAN